MCRSGNKPSTVSGASMPLNSHFALYASTTAVAAGRSGSYRNMFTTS